MKNENIKTAYWTEIADLRHYIVIILFNRHLTGQVIKNKVFSAQKTGKVSEETEVWGEMSHVVEEHLKTPITCVQS